jgi:hypothetical protein
VIGIPAYATLIANKSFSGVRDTGYVIALDTDRRLVVVSFRGSRSLTNIASAFSSGILPSVATDLCSGCLIADPFFTVYQSVRATIVATVRNTMANNPGFQVVTTGHSLGGALSHLAGLEFRNLGLTVDLVSD